VRLSHYKTINILKFYELKGEKFEYAEEVDAYIIKYSFSLL